MRYLISVLISIGNPPVILNGPKKGGFKFMDAQRDDLYTYLLSLEFSYIMNLYTFKKIPTKLSLTLVFRK